MFNTIATLFFYIKIKNEKSNKNKILKIMETLNPPMRKHYNLFIYLIVIFCLPTILLLYILFGIFTIPLSIYFYRNHKDQVS